jgi:hypothetical protein
MLPVFYLKVVYLYDGSQPFDGRTDGEEFSLTANGL